MFYGYKTLYVDLSRSWLCLSRRHGKWILFHVQILFSFIFCHWSFGKRCWQGQADCWVQYLNGTMVDPHTWTHDSRAFRAHLSYPFMDCSHSDVLVLIIRTSTASFCIVHELHQWPNYIWALGVPGLSEAGWCTRTCISGPLIQETTVCLR